MAKVEKNSNQELNKKMESAVVYAGLTLVVGFAIAIAFGLLGYAFNVVALIAVFGLVAAAVVFGIEYRIRQSKEDTIREITVNEEVMQNKHEREMDVQAAEDEQQERLAIIASKTELARIYMLADRYDPEFGRLLRSEMEKETFVPYQIEKPKEQKGYVLLKSGEQSPLFNVDDLKQILRNRVQFGTGQNVTTATGETRIVSIDNNKISPLMSILVNMAGSPVFIGVGGKYEVKKDVTVDSAMEWLERRVKYVA